MNGLYKCVCLSSRCRVSIT